MGLLDEYVENDAVKVLEVKYKSEGYGVVSTQDTPHEHEGHEGLLNERVSSNAPLEIDLSEVLMLDDKAKGAIRASVMRKKKQDKKTEELCKLYGFVNFGRYACDSSTARLMFESRRPTKPAWAVRALVLLRTHGACEVCREPISTSGEVKRLVPVKLGGRYVEVNTIAVCAECAKVWTHKNFFYGAGMDRALVMLKLYVMKRRNEGRNNARPLNDVGYAECKRLLSLLERQKLTPSRRNVLEDEEDIIKALK